MSKKPTMEAITPNPQTAEHLVRSLLECYGIEENQSTKDTPLRVAKMYAELLIPKPFTFTVFDSNGYDEMILSKHIPFHTLCEHHLLPFFGTVTIGYIPSGQICGLSKLARTVEFFSRGLNTQEYMTQRIADFIEANLHPLGLGVLVKGRHLCQEMRGIQRQSEMITSCLKGVFMEERVKNEFLIL